MYKIIKYFLKPVFIFCVFFLMFKKNTFCKNNFGYKAVSTIGFASTFLRENTIDFSKYSTLNFIIPLFGWYGLYTILEKNFEGIIFKKTRDRCKCYKFSWWKIGLTALSLMLHRKIDPGDGANIIDATTQSDLLVESARNSLEQALENTKDVRVKKEIGEALNALNQ